MLAVLPALGVAFTIILLAYRKQTARGAKSLIAFSVAIIMWAIVYAFYALKRPTNWLPWSAFFYFCETFTATTLLTFSIEYTNHQKRLNWWAIVILAIEPLLAQIMLWIGPWRAVLFAESVPVDGGIFISSDSWFSFQPVYSNCLMILALVLLAQTFPARSSRSTSRSFVIAIGMAIPMLFTTLEMVGIKNAAFMDQIPLSFSITGLLFVFCILRMGLFDLASIERDMVVENMSEAWMVIDAENRIVDLNRAAEQTIGSSRQAILGQRAESVIESWSKIIREPSDNRSEMKGSIQLQGKWRYLDVRVSPLIRPPEQQIGNVVLWRDITERKKAEEARRSSRDYMFVLLDAISDIANRSMTVYDFLVEALYQISYSYRSDAGFIFLLNKMDSDGGKQDYYLAAHHGFSTDELVQLSTSKEVARVIARVTNHKESFFGMDANSGMPLPPPIYHKNSNALLLAPLIADEITLGVIGIIKRNGNPYGEDDLARFNIVAFKLASFLHNNRQRQVAITQEERQRLARDLHDSVTQKLYGLVQLTEAAQASLDSGSVAQSATALVRIGDCARQALKEMRLVLFEMKPVDLEHEGLVVALNQRLAAVEGRADIKARLLADDELPLSLDSEIALYFIAQEALNNILKHASAKIVTVYLKKRKANVELRVEDDGCGFDRKSIDKGGMGLRTMQERAERVGGLVRIKSIPGRGTSVIALVSRSKVFRETGW